MQTKVNGAASRRRAAAAVIRQRRVSADAGACGRRSWCSVGAARARWKTASGRLNRPGNPSANCTEMCCSPRTRKIAHLWPTRARALILLTDSLADPSPAPRPHRITRCQKVPRGIVDSAASRAPTARVGRACGTDFRLPGCTADRKSAHALGRIWIDLRTLASGAEAQP